MIGTVEYFDTGSCHARSIAEYVLCPRGFWPVGFTGLMPKVEFIGSLGSGMCVYALVREDFFSTLTPGGAVTSNQCNCAVQYKQSLSGVFQCLTKEPWHE